MLENKHNLTVDTQSKSIGNAFVEVVQNDNVALEVQIYNNNLLVDNTAYTYTLLSVLPSKERIIRQGEIGPNGYPVFNLGVEEMSETGIILAMVQVYDELGNRVTSYDFKYRMKEDLSTGGVVPSADNPKFVIVEESLLTETLANSKTALENSEQAVTTSNSVQEQFNQVVINGDSSVESAQARVNADGSVTYTTLKDRLDTEYNQVAAQLAETTKKISHFEPYQLEKEGETHIDGYTYTGFFSGVNMGGKEVHVGRTGQWHGGGESKLIAYIRQDDGSFTKKIVGGIDYTIGDFRDVNLSYIEETKTTYLSIAVLKNDGNYSNYMGVFNANADVENFSEMLGMENVFGWGNIITSSEGLLLKCAYTPTDGNGVGLYSSPIANPYQYTKIVDLFEPHTTKKPSEATICQWGDKLVAVARTTGLIMYRETYDLTGKTGWSDVKELALIGHAPVMLPYTKKGEPLIIGWSVSIPDIALRSPYFIATFDGVNITDRLFLQQLTGDGGYQSLVPNRNGFGAMYYENGLVSSTTNVYYKEVDIINALQPELDTLRKKYEQSTIDDFCTLQDGKTAYGFLPSRIDHSLSSNANNWSVKITVTKTITIDSIFTMSRSSISSLADAKVNVYEDGVEKVLGVNIQLEPKEESPSIYRFPIPKTVLLAGHEYKFVFIGSCSLFDITSIKLPLYFPHFIIDSVLSPTDVMYNLALPFALGITV